MKNRSKNTLKWISGGVILLIALVISEIWLATLITQNKPEAYGMCLFIMILITIFVYLIIAIVKLMQYQNCSKRYRQKALEKAKESLNWRFKPVLLNASSCIPKEMFKCLAKVGDDGIVCKIHLDCEIKVTSYEEFLKYFHFTEK